MYDREFYERIQHDPLPRDLDACPSCNGAQYVRYFRPLGDSLFGKYTQCPRCAPKKREGDE